MIRLFLNFEHETLQCEARVVRVEPRNGQFGVAVELKSYFFVENERELNADGGFLCTAQWRKSHRTWSRVNSAAVKSAI